MLCGLDGCFSRCQKKEKVNQSNKLYLPVFWVVETEPSFKVRGLIRTNGFSSSDSTVVELVSHMPNFKLRHLSPHILLGSGDSVLSPSVTNLICVHRSGWPSNSLVRKKDWSNLCTQMSATYQSFSPVERLV